MADRHWVTGGTGFFSSTTNWSTSSGGSGGASVPTTGDTAYFDVNSGEDTVVTIDIAVLCHINTTDSVNLQFDVISGGSLSLQESLSIYGSTIEETGFLATNDYNVSSDFLNLYDTATAQLGTSTINVSLGLDAEGTTEGDVEITGGTFVLDEGSSVYVINSTITGSTATGGATFNAFSVNGNVDGGGNTGWNFGSMQEEITESLLINDSQDTEWTLAGGHYFDQTISEDLGMEDIQDSTGTFNNSLTESVDLADSHIIGWLESLADGVTIIDSHAIGWAKTIEDILFLYEELKSGWGLSITEDLTLTDSLSYVLGLLISDWLTIVDTQTNNWNGREIVPDTLNLYDIAQGGKRFSDTINESLAVTDESLYKLTVTVLEYLGFTDLANALRTGSETVSDTVALADTPAAALSFLISETLSVVDAGSVIASFIHSVDESLGLADAASLINRIGLTVTEPLTFTETISSQAHLYSAVYDAIALNVVVELADDIYECYVLNTAKFHPSMYSGFDFNSFCVFENRAFGANELGVYELTGDTDAGTAIHTGVILSQTDFGAPNQKRFRHGYLGISGANPVMVFECEDGTRQAYNIDIKGHVVASSELKSKKWVLSIADYESLDTIKLIPIVLTK